MASRGLSDPVVKFKIRPALFASRTPYVHVLWRLENFSRVILTYLCDKERHKTLFQIGNIFVNEIISPKKAKNLSNQPISKTYQWFFNQNDLRSISKWLGKWPIFDSKSSFFDLSIFISDSKWTIFVSIEDNRTWRSFTVWPWQIP